MSENYYSILKCLNNQATKFTLMCLLFFFSISVSSQVLQGSVYGLDGEGNKEALIGVHVYLSESKEGVVTNTEGLFKITEKFLPGEYIVASYMGYVTDSVKISAINNLEQIEIVLKEGLELEETVVVGAKKGAVFSSITPQKTELITTTGLQKMACCNLSESFENSASITVGYTDAVSGAKQVQLLGLSSIYSQITDENVPMLRGLSSTYGWSYIPGPWLESVQLSKGASSVVNGYESVSGQINVEHKKPNLSEPLFINLYVDDAKRMEANVTTTTQINKKWSTALFAHGSMEKEEHDSNDDTFMDVPKMELANLYGRLFYLDNESGIQSRFGVKLIHEKREAGQIESKINSGDRLYETNIKNRNFNVYNKTGITIGDKQGQSLGLINSFTYHEQNSAFGDKLYDGTQHSYYGNLLFSSYIGNTSHRYTTGLSLTYDNYKTKYEDRLPFNQTPLTKIDREEVVPGAFGEYTYDLGGKFTFIAGMRVDHNSRYGWLFTPRSNVRYSILDNLVFRLSAGRGCRSANVIAENIGLLASSRMMDVSNINDLNMEKAWNYGANLTFYLPIWNSEMATISMDYFRTDFQDQAIADIDRSKNNVYFYNLSGNSYANVFQTDLSMTLMRGFDLFAAFRVNNTQVTYSDGTSTYKMEKPLTSRYRGLVNLAYATRLRKWVFDATAQFNGPARIPGMNGYQSEKRESEAFPVFFTQITKNSKRFDIYLGVENLLDYKQKNPILNYNDPFGRDFDSSMIWGPLMGRKIYGGIRWRIGKLY